VTPSSPVYDRIGPDYATHRRADARWAALINRALGDARRVINVGAGTGSYEPPAPTQVVAVEPSVVMIGQRSTGTAPVVRASGTALPIGTDSFDAALAVLTLHHWGDWSAGLTELARVAPHRVILTIDFEIHALFWLLEDYLPEVAEVERRLRPTPADIADVIPVTQTVTLPLPPDLADGVLGCFWRQPEAYLDPVVRANTSPLALADPAVVGVGMRRLASDLANGRWHERHGHLFDVDQLDLGYRLLISDETTSAVPSDR
jgi:SAM-dependent methyltransferase